MQATMPDDRVIALAWPEDADELSVLRRAGTPRLLLVTPGAPAPTVTSELEDWVRLPADDEDVESRVATLAARASAQRADAPRVDDDDLLHWHGRWVGLSSVEAALARPLVTRLGEVVAYAELARAQPGPPRRETLRVQLTRLRLRLAPLGLVIHSVRGRGYVLRPPEGPPRHSPTPRRGTP